MLNRSLLCWLALSVLAPSTIFAAEYEPNGPLTLRNQSPIYLLFLNVEPTRAKTLSKGDISLRIDNAYSNIFEYGIGTNTDLMFDMELLRTSLNVDFGVSDNMEVGIEIPFLHFEGGGLDEFLQRYHNAFNFPNGGREFFPNGSFTYRFNEGGTALYNVNQEDFNIGDITLDFKHNFVEEGKYKPAVTWLFYFKIPSGDRGEGLGSGNIDFGLAAALEKSYKRWHWFLNLAYLVNGGHGPLDNYLRQCYFTYVFATEFSISKPVSVVAQIYGGSPLLKGTGMTQWDSVPLDLQIGFKGEHALGRTPNSELRTPRLTWQVGFSEDLNANGPSVDITVFGSVGVKFKAW